MNSVRFQKRMAGQLLIAGLFLISACATSKYRGEHKAINKQLNLIYEYVSDSKLSLSDAEKDYYAKQLEGARNFLSMSLDPTVYKLVHKDLKRIKHELKKKLKNS